MHSHTDKTMSQQLVVVRTSPVVKDPRELQTILIVSLRSLYGELEPHSCVTSVLEIRGDKALIRCPTGSTASVRAALTLCTLPHYMHHNTMQFDVLEIIQDDSSSTSKDAMADWSRKEQ